MTPDEAEPGKELVLSKAPRAVEGFKSWLARLGHRASQIARRQTMHPDIDAGMNAVVGSVKANLAEGDPDQMTWHANRIPDGISLQGGQVPPERLTAMAAEVADSIRGGIGPAVNTLVDTTLTHMGWGYSLDGSVLEGQSNLESILVLAKARGAPVRMEVAGGRMLASPEEIVAYFEDRVDQVLVGGIDNQITKLGQDIKDGLFMGQAEFDHNLETWLAYMQTRGFEIVRGKKQIVGESRGMAGEELTIRRVDVEALMVHRDEVIKAHLATGYSNIPNLVALGMKWGHQDILTRARQKQQAYEEVALRLGLVDEALPHLTELGNINPRQFEEELKKTVSENMESGVQGLENVYRDNLRMGRAGLAETDLGRMPAEYADLAQFAGLNMDAQTIRDLMERHRTGENLQAGIDHLLAQTREEIRSGRFYEAHLGAMTLQRYEQIADAHGLTVDSGPMRRYLGQFDMGEFKLPERKSQGRPGISSAKPST